MSDDRDRITIEPGKRSGKPCVRGLRITVYDVLSYLAAGMTTEEVLEDFPSLTREDVLACLAYAADREQQTLIVSPRGSCSTTTCRLAFHDRLVTCIPAPHTSRWLAWSAHLTRTSGDRLSTMTASS